MEAQRKARESAQQAAQAQALVALERDNTARQVARVLSAAIVRTCVKRPRRSRHPLTPTPQRISQQGNAHDVKGVPTGVVTVLAGPPPADDSMQAAASAVVAAFAEQDHAASAAVVRAVRSSEQLSGLADAVAAAQGTAFGGDSLRGALLVRAPRSPRSRPQQQACHPNRARGRKSCAPSATNSGRAATPRSSSTRPAAC